VRVLVAGLLLLVGMLTGCGTEEVDAQGSWLMVGASLPDGRWEADNGGKYFLRVRGQSADGTSGCDAFEARVAQDGGDFSFQDFQKSARPGCPGDVPDPLEGRFLGALRSVDSAERDGDLLILRGDDTTLTLESTS
jgi:hypothetical protein